jgi:type I restriction enzyme M protein
MERRNIYSAEYQFSAEVSEYYLTNLLGHSMAELAERVHKIAHNSYSVTTDKKDPFLAISFAPVHDFNAAEAKLKDTIQNTDTVGLGIITDGTATNLRVLRRRFDRNEFEYLRDFEPISLIRMKGQTSRLFCNGGNEVYGRPLSLLTERVEDVFFEVHSHLRDIDGLHADEALDELCKLLYLKLFDEETTKEGQSYRVQRWLYSCVEECAAAIRSVYREANDYDLRVFGMKIPGYNRSRGVFNEPIKLSSPALVKAMETMQEYHLGKSAIDVKGRAFQKVLGPTIRSGMGQYFTPDPVVRFLSRIVQPTVHDLILDPFCGSGHFLTACLQIVRDEHKREDKAFHEFAFGKLHGIEKSDRMVRVAMTDMRLHGDGHSNIRCTDALLTNYPDIQPESFDIILTNPPFGSLLGPEAIGQLGAFRLVEGRGNVPMETIGLERCIQLLRPGGRLGIVIPDGTLANINSAYVREWLSECVKVRAIISLPIETFVPFGASIKTSILIVRKWMPGEARDISYPVFLARVDNIGYDATGRHKREADIERIADTFIGFLEREGW